MGTIYNERLLVFSDIHGNLHALKALLRRVEQLKVDRMVCLGDVVGYGADPDECFKILHEKNVPILMGNHEAMLFDAALSKECSELGKQSARWTSENTSTRTKELASSLNHSLIKGHIVLCHAAPCSKGWPYCNQKEHLWETWKDMNGTIGIYGHTHRARLTVFESGRLVEDKYILKKSSIRLLIKPEQKILINVGSVGQQRDTKTDVGFAIIESDGKTDEMFVHFHRIKYNSLGAYIRTLQGCGRSIADYLVREKWRKRVYGILGNWWAGIRWP